MKTIAFLATGSELLTGDLQESNAYQAAKMLYQRGGVVGAMVIIGDALSDITRQLLHLLETHDAVITIGGLGPTSDDNTRFALSEALQLPLVLDEGSWLHIQERMQRFGLNVSASNRNQALFPSVATILKNHAGSANACHLRWKDRDIFMLPGPPKEFHSLFLQEVIPYLEKERYFHLRKIYQYLTLGLIEGEIATEIDTIANPAQLLTSYRWHYPYLDIKLIAPEIEHRAAVLAIERRLEKHIVSTDLVDAQTHLKEYLAQCETPILVQVTNDLQSLLAPLHHDKLQFLDSMVPVIDALPVVSFEVKWPEMNEAAKKVVHLMFAVKIKTQILFQHQLSAPARDDEVASLLQSYFAWQLLLSRSI